MADVLVEFSIAVVLLSFSSVVSYEVASKLIQLTPDPRQVSFCGEWNGGRSWCGEVGETMYVLAKPNQTKK